MEELVRARTKPTHRVRLLAWLLLLGDIRGRGKGRAERVVVVRPLVFLRHPDVARRVGLEPGSPGLAAAERSLERRGYVRPVTVGTDVGAFVVTDAGTAWLEQDRWVRPCWRRVLG